MAHPHKKKPVSSNRRQIAKALRDATGLTYQQALRRVEDAAARGLLPAVLNKVGQEEAVRLLTSYEAATSTVAPAPSGSRVPDSRPEEAGLPLFQRGGSEKTSVRFDPPTSADFAAAARIHDHVLVFDLDAQPSLSGPWPSPALSPFTFEPVIFDAPLPGTYDPTLGLTAAEQEEVLRLLRPPVES